MLFSLLAVTAYCVVSLILGIRLLALARRTRELPETLFGFSFLAGGMVGYPFNVAAGLLRSSDATAGHICYAIAQLGLAAAAILSLLAWRRIFAPALRGGTALTIAWSLLLVSSVAIVIGTTGADVTGRMTSPVYWAQLLLQGGCYALSAFASLRYASMLRRRLALGLADPIVANRMQLWGVSHAAITGSYLCSLTMGILIANGLAEPGRLALLTPLIAGFGLTAATCVTFAFLPPKAYLARLRSMPSSTQAPEGA